MKVTLTILFGLLVAVSKSQCTSTSEVTYQYEALVNTYVERPKPFSSSFMIRYQLTSQIVDDKTFIQIKNATYTMYSGKGTEPNSVFESIPTEAEALLTPFVITRNSDVKTVSILTTANEPAWSLDMKKGLASLLQIDVLKIVGENQHAYGFVTSEYSLYGDCPVTYSVVPASKGKFTIKKNIDPTKCHGASYKFNYNLKKRHCDRQYTKPISAVSTHVYEVEAIDSDFKINNIEGTNAIILAEFDGNSDAYSMRIQQKMTLINARTVEEITLVNSPYTAEHKLKASFVQQDGESSLMELLGGRGVYDLDSVPNKVIEGYRHILKHLDGKVTISYDNRDETVHYLIEQLRLLDVKHLEIVFNAVKSDPSLLKTFVYSLPIAGTRAAIMFIRDLVVEKKLENDDAKIMIALIPLYIRYPNRETWKELIPLRNVDDEELKNTVVLSLSSVASKILENHPDDPFVLKSLDDLIEKFNSTTDIAKQMLYISAFSNIKTQRVFKYLEGIVASDLSERKLSPQLKSLVVWAFKNSDANIQFLWPLLRDHSEHLQVRAAALSVLMTNPSVETLMQLQMALQNEKNSDLYSIYYTYLVSISKTSWTCYEKSAIYARQILAAAKLPTPKKSDSINKVIDYLDKKYQFGMMLGLTAVGNIRETNLATYRIEPSVEMAGFNLNQFVLHVILSYTEEGKSIGHIIYSHNDRVIMVQNLIDTRIHDQVLAQNIVNATFFLGTGVKMLNLFEMTADGETVFPTDLGTPAMLYLQMAVTHRIKYSCPEGMTDLMSLAGKTNFEFSFGYKQLNHQIYGMKVYNPIVDTWHGVRRNHITDLNLPFNMTFELEKNGFDALFNTEQDGEIFEYKFESNAFSQVFIDSLGNNQDKLKHVCKECEAYNQVSHGKEHQINKVLWEVDCEHTDTKYQFVVFDCERPVTSSRISQLKKSIFGNENKNLGKWMIVELAMKMRHAWAYIASSPAAGRCGMRLVAKPNFTRTKFSLESVQKQRDVSKLILNQTFYNGEESKSWELTVASNNSRFLLAEYMEQFQLNFTSVHGHKICIMRLVQNSDLSYLDQLVMFSNNGETADCSYDKEVLRVKGVGEVDRTRGSSLADDAFEECYSTDKSLLTCVAEQTYYDAYNYYINYANAPKEIMNIWKVLSEDFRKDFGGYATRSPKEKKDSDATIVVKYEPFSNEPTIQISYPTELVEYDSLPISDTPWRLLFIRDSFEVPTVLDGNNFLSKKEEFVTRECYVRNNLVISHSGYERNANLTKEWKTMIKTKYDDDIPVEVIAIMVNVRKSESTNLLEFQLSWTQNSTQEVLTITPTGQSVNLTLNEKPLNKTPGYYQLVPFSYKVTPKMFYIFFPKWIQMPIVLGENFGAVVYNSDIESGMCKDD